MTSPTQPAGGEPDLSSDGDLWVDRSAANLASFWEHAVRAMGQRWARWDDVWAADPQSLHPIPNSATLLRPLDAAQVPGLIERVSRFYGAGQGAPWALWSAWPTPDLQTWGCHLIGQPPLMVRPPGGAVPPAPLDLRLVEAADATTLADFEAVFINGYPLPELQPVQGGALYDTRVLGGRLRLWVGYAGDRAVTTAAAYLDDEVTGIYCVATLPEARGHGYGAAVTAQAALADPARPAVLQASDLGYPIYKRLGFAEVARYDLWVAPRQSAA